MKRLVTLAWAAAFFCAGDATLAQDFAPPRLTSPAPEAATPTPLPSVPAGPTPTPPKPSTPRQKASLAAPRRDVLREPPVHAVEKPAPFLRRAPAPPQTTRSGSASRPTFDLAESSWVTAATIRSLENRWEAAVKDHNEDALKELLAPSFEATTAKGTEAGRRRILSLLRRDKNVYHSTRAHGMRVHSTGNRTVVVTGTSTESGLTADGKKFKVARAFTDTWRQRNDHWQCISSRVASSDHR